mgnify:CR=1 FL=1
MKSYNILKSIGLSITLLISITILTLGCKKNSSEEFIQKNETLILKSSNLISIISSDVISAKNYFIRKIDLLTFFEEQKMHSNKFFFFLKN